MKEPVENLMDDVGSRGVFMRTSRVAVAWSPRVVNRRKRKSGQTYYQRLEFSPIYIQALSLTLDAYSIEAHGS